MKRKLLAILVATTLSITLVACGGGEKETPTNQEVVNLDTATDDSNTTTNDADATTNDADATADDEVTGEFTEEQAALAQEYLDMCAAYDETVEMVNATPEILEHQDLIDEMNGLADAIIEVDELFGDPANLTPEVMDEMRVAFDSVYAFIDEANALAEAVGTSGDDVNVDDIASVLTIAYGGADEAENTYYFACDENVTFGALVILSADMTQNVYCIGDMVDNGDGTVTINDEEGYTITFAVTEAEGGVFLTLEDGTEVAMAARDAAEIIEMMLTIDAETENVNE